MAVNDYYRQIANDLGEIKIDILGVEAASSLSKILLAGSSNEFEELGLAEFEDWMEKALSYNIYLKSQKGSIEAKIIILEGEYSRLLGLETQTIERPRDGGFLSKEEKEASALLRSDTLVDLRDKLLVAKAKLAKIKDLPFAIDKKINMMQFKYKRRYQLEYGYRDKSGA